MRGSFVAVIAIGILSGAVFGLSHLSSQNLLTGNFYKREHIRFKHKNGKNSDVSNPL